jgi:hypothetical protein
MGSNLPQSMDVCMRLFCVCVVLCVGSGLATDWSLVQGVLPTVYRNKKLKKRAKIQQKGCRDGRWMGPGFISRIRYRLFWMTSVIAMVYLTIMGDPRLLL